MAAGEASFGARAFALLAALPVLWVLLSSINASPDGGEGIGNAVVDVRGNTCRLGDHQRCTLRDSLNFAMNADFENTTELTLEQDLDAMLLSACRALGVEDPELNCAPGSGARLVDSKGSRVMFIEDLIFEKSVPPIYVVPRWLHFVWPTVEIGHVVEPTNVVSADPENPIKLKTLSHLPRVFQIKNFMSSKEAAQLIEQNRDKIQRSTVGATATYDKTRTSSNTWDISTTLAKRFKKRAFDLLAMDHDVRLEDGLQVLNYKPGQYYKPHVDWLNPETEDMVGNLVPTVNNGTNRFATVFFYLNSVEAGGHTVFPRSVSHGSFDGNKVMRDGPKNPPPGYISDRDAAWACNTSSSALRSEPIAGDAVLFYNQLPDSVLDHESLHGGCPVIEGEKWAVNLWIWNRPRAGSFRAKTNKAKGAQKKNGQISFNLFNQAGRAADIHWVHPESGDLQKISTIEAEDKLGMNSYNTHTFVATDKGTKSPRWWTHVVSPKDEGIQIVVKYGDK